MEEDIKSLMDYVQMAKRQKYLILLPMLLLIILSVSVALLLPAVYRSEATILIEQQHIPVSLVQSTVVSFADERIKQIEQRVMTIDNVNKIIKKYGLYKKQSKELSQTALAEKFRENTELTLVTASVIGRGRGGKATLAFKLAFNNKEPVIAQKIANEMVTLYLSANVVNRTERAAETTKFLEDEARKFKVEIQKIENEIAEYKESNKNSLPELLPVNIASISRVENNLQQLSLQEKILNERRVRIRTQLNATSPNVITGTSSQGGGENLASLEAQYLYLLGKYSESHPDVRAVKRKMKALPKSEVGTKTTIITANNPVYVQLRSEQSIAANELRYIYQQRLKLRKSLDELEIRVSKTHQVERGYYDLMRDLDNNKQKYQELKAKSLDAKLSQTLEEEQKAEKFSLIEPARVPRKPVKPNRFKILMMGLALSVAVGFGIGYLAEILDGSLRGHKALEKLTGIEPLVVIPYIKIQVDIDERKKNIRRLIVISSLLLVAVVAATHFLYQPLDMIWYKVLNRINMF